MANHLVYLMKLRRSGCWHREMLGHTSNKHERLSLFHGNTSYLWSATPNGRHNQRTR